MAAQSREFNIVGDGWCLYNAYLTVFTTNRLWYTDTGIPMEDAQQGRTRAANNFASKLASLATDADKQYITQRLTSQAYDGIEIMDASGRPTGRFGYPSQLNAEEGSEYVVVSGQHKKTITTADEYLRAMRTPIIDTGGNTQPEAWGSISLIRPLLIRYRPDIYFDVRVRDENGEVDANVGGALMGQEELKYVGPSGEINLSLINVGNHYNSRVYKFVSPGPVAVVDEDDELLAATLGSLLISVAGLAIESESNARAVRPGAVARIQKLASTLPTIREERPGTIETEQKTPVVQPRNRAAIRPAAPYTSIFNAARAAVARIKGMPAPAAIPSVEGGIPAEVSSSERRRTRGEQPIEIQEFELQSIAREPVRRGTYYGPAVPSAAVARSSRVTRGGPEPVSRLATPVGPVAAAAAAAPVAPVPEYVPRMPVAQPGADIRGRNLRASVGAEPIAYNRRLNAARAQSISAPPTALLTAGQEGLASRAIRRVGRAIAATVPEPGGVEYVPQPVPPLPSVSGLFPRISIPTFDSTTIPQPRHRRRHPYRRFVAPPAPPAAPVAAQAPRSTEIPAWAAQHITQANVAANVKGVAAAVVDDVLAMQDYHGVNADPAYAAYKANPKTRGLDSSGGDPVHWDELVERYPDRNVLIRDGSGDLHKFRVSNPYRAAGYRRKPTFTFGDPTGLNPQQSVMAQQNLDVLMEIAPEEMIADTKYATALLESLWYCGAAKDIGADPRCFPARVLGELREYKMYKDERARAALASRARQYSEWEFIKGVLRKVRGQLSGVDKAVGPVVVSGIPDVVGPVAGPNLSAAVSSTSVAALAGRSAAAGPAENAFRIIPGAASSSPEPPAASAAAAAPKKDAGPAPRRRLQPVARVALAEPPRTLGAIGLRPMPPPAVLGAWGSRFRPIIPGI